MNSLQKIVGITIIGLIYFTNYSFAQSYILRGKVLDDTTGEPIEFATVYINKTTNGTVTDSEGEFELTFTQGQPELVVSFAGYHPIVHLLDVTTLDQEYTFKMAADTKILNDVEVRSTRDSIWYLNLEVFKREFIGRTTFGTQCELINIVDLIIDYSPKTNIMEVRAKNALTINNYGLGYQIQYLLNHFKYDLNNGYLTFAGYTYFAPLEGNKRKLKKWNKNRLKAYNGSSMHFLRALRKRQLEEEQFNLRRLIREPNPERPSDEKIKAARWAYRNTRDSLTQTALDSITDILARARKPRILEYLDTAKVAYENYLIESGEVSELKFDGYFQVVYIGEKEEPSYVRSRSLFRQREPTFQTSIISLTVESDKINPSGSMQDPYSLVYEGYWSWEKLGDMLPLNYTIGQ
ncbi:MAG: carboxypeptidase-like regulatory domain-containing protein [Bacteroidota bacterium]